MRSAAELRGAGWCLWPQRQATQPPVHLSPAGTPAAALAAPPPPPPPGAPSTEEVHAAPGQGLLFGGSGHAVRFGDTPQDVVSELGTPDSVYYKQAGAADSFAAAPAAAAAAAAAAGGRGSPAGGGGAACDYFYNYRARGVNVLFSGALHRATKIVLHANAPGHPDFGAQARCNFRLHLGSGWALPQDWEGEEGAAAPRGGAPLSEVRREPASEAPGSGGWEEDDGATAFEGVTASSGSSPHEHSGGSEAEGDAALRRGAQPAATAASSGAAQGDGSSSFAAAAYGALAGLMGAMDLGGPEEEEERGPLAAGRPPLPPGAAAKQPAEEEEQRGGRRKKKKKKKKGGGGGRSLLEQQLHRGSATESELASDSGARLGGCSGWCRGLVVQLLHWTVQGAVLYRAAALSANLTTHGNRRPGRLLRLWLLPGRRRLPGGRVAPLQPLRQRR